MWRTEMCWFGVGNWIFLLATLHLFTYVQGTLNQDEGVRLTAEPPDTVAGVGERVELPCTSSPGSRVSWRHSDAEPTREHVISLQDKYRKQLPNGSLVIESMTAALSGRYQCVATGDSGTVVSRVAEVFLAELPTLKTPPRTILAVTGEAVLLPCEVSTGTRVVPRVLGATGPVSRPVYTQSKIHPPPMLKLNVTWLKNGSPIRGEGARAALSASGALELDPARTHDAGVYRCRVALAHATHVYTTGEEIELRVNTEPASVEYPPRFIATPQPVTVLEGASITFDCAAVGNPKPEIIWLNNGVAIDLNDLDSRFHLWGSGSLRVSSVRTLDAGAYTCRAHNRLDSNDHTTHLHVLSPPRATIPPPSVVGASARGDVTLRCDVRGRPTPNVRWLKDGDTLTPNNHDIALVDLTSLRIQGVLRQDAGMFQCFATSTAGTSVAAVRLMVLPPDPEPKTSSSDIDSSFPISNNNSLETQNSQEIFNSLISSGPILDQTDLNPDLDFLGETSPAFTSEPEYDTVYDDDDDEDDYFNANNNNNDNDENSLHAAKDMDIKQLRQGNASVVSTPKDFKAVIVKHRFVTLSWDEPDKKEEDVTGYAVVYQVKGSDRERVSVGAGTKHEMNIGSLLPNTTYEFTLVALTDHAVSPPTESIEVITPSEEVLFGPPVSVRAEATGPHTIRVEWGPPAQGSPTKYAVYYTESDTSREQVQYVEAPSLSAVITDARAATLYSVRVSAAEGAGSAAVRVRTPADVPAAPPNNVTAVATGATSILVRWEPPPLRSLRGSLTGYKVRYRALSATAAGPRRKADSLTTPADSRRAALTHLMPATTYQIRVCAINANGSGPFSEWVQATTQQQEVDETRVPPQPPPLTTRAGRDWISVWWSEEGWSGGGSGGGWWLGWGRGVPDTHSRELPQHLHSHVIRGLESNAEYVISLRASNALGLGPAVYATVQTKPAAVEGDDEGEDEGEEEEEGEGEEEDSPPLIPPVGLKVIMLSGTTAVVYWTDPTLPKGQTATDGRHYVVRYSTSGGRVRTYNASDLNCMLDDLKPFTTYEFAVKLIKGGRESPWSMLVSNTTLEATPGAPRDTRASPTGPPARAVDLSWLPPAKPNGIITGYVIMYAIQRSSGEPDWTAITTPIIEGSDRPRSRVDRLRPRTTYLFKIQARNSKGLGPFGPTISYTTAMESGEGTGLAAATSAWLWASAGGAVAVLALALALALSLCCRRTQPPLSLSPGTSTYQKSAASAAIKPPDLWIHHDQMELKHMDKSLHSSAMSAGSVEGGSALVSSTLTLRAPPAEYEPARHAPPASLDRRHYVPTYVGSGASCASDDTCVLRSSPRSCSHCDASMTGVGVGSMGNMGGMNTMGNMGSMGVGNMGTLGGVSCASTCERRQHRPMLPDQSTPLLGSTGLTSPQSSLSLHALHPAHAHTQPPPAPCGSGTCPLGAACGAGGGVVTAGGDIYACAARERGHYVAYEPLGHYTHRDSLSSEGGVVPLSSGPPGGPCGPTGVPSAGGSLQRRPQPLHSFSDTSDHSTPSHSNRSVRESSPYKKSASSSPGHIPNRLQLGGPVSVCSEELEPLTPSRSTERLQREMQNLEGLMKDLSAITQNQFHC